MNLDELKALIEEQGKAFVAFKTANEERLAAIEAGQGTAEIDAKLERINAELNETSKAIERVGQVENRLNKLALGGGGQDPQASEHRKAFEDWFRRGRGEDELRALERRALSVQSDPDGGFTVPVEVERSVGRVLSTVSAMRQVANVVQISGDRLTKLVTTTGANAGWVGEAGSRDETTGPKLSAIEIPTKEVYANPAATQKLLDDSFVNIEQWLAGELAAAFGEKEGDAFINGDGVNSPRGLLAYDTAANASYAWGKIGYIKTGEAAAFPSTDPEKVIIQLVYALKRGYRMNGAFLANDAVISKIRQFKDATTGTYLWQPSLQAGEPARLLGYPIYSDDNMPDEAANKYILAFGNFGQAYTIVDRVGIRTLRDPYTNKPYVHFYTTKRVGGGVTNFEAVKLLKCSA